MTAHDDYDPHLVSRLHQALVEVLTAEGETGLAAIIVDSELTLLPETRDAMPALILDIPVAYFGFFSDPESAEAVRVAEKLSGVAYGHIPLWDGGLHRPRVMFRAKLPSADAGWEQRAKALLAQGGATNQGLVTDLVFARAGKEVLTYNELKFASRTEIRIAQELERRGLLYFPLAIAVKAKTGVLHEDHREVDFLICQGGVFGILEISGPTHAGRYEQDSEKADWFRQEGILCVLHYTAENAWDNTAAVVDNFLSVLAQHKR